MPILANERRDDVPVERNGERMTTRKMTRAQLQEAKKERNETKDELTFDEWFDEYMEALIDLTGMCDWSDKRIAQRHWERGKTPESAAKEDARFMATGEY